MGRHARTGYRLGIILTYWTGILHFGTIEPDGYVQLRAPGDKESMFGGYGSPRAYGSPHAIVMERNVRLVLKDLGIPFPSDLMLDRVGLSRRYWLNLRHTLRFQSARRFPVETSGGKLESQKSPMWSWTKRLTRY